MRKTMTRYVGNQLLLINNERFNNKEKIVYNGKEMGKGIFILNKTMYMANILYFLIYDEILIPSSDWWKWKNGPINRGDIIEMWISNENRDFDDCGKSEEELNKINLFLKNVDDFFSDFDDLDLYRITHDDIGYKETKDNDNIQIEKYKDRYKDQYAKLVKFFKEEYHYE